MRYKIIFFVIFISLLAFSQQVNAERICDSFTQEYDDIILTNIGKEHLDLVRSIIQIESDYSHNAYRYESRYGDTSYGLMQLLTKTAKKLEEKYDKLPRLGSTDEEIKKALYEPEINIAYGVALLKEELERYDYNYILAVSAYNAGSNASLTARKQQQLNELLSEELVLDGDPGPRTSEVVKAFQEWYNSQPEHKGKEIHLLDGRLGDETNPKIDEVWENRHPNQPNPKGIIPQNGRTPKHIEDFQKALDSFQNKGCETCNKLSSIDIKKAIKKDYITAIFSGTGTYTGRSIRLNINNKTDEYLKIKVPLGLILYSDNLEDQNMVISKEEIICLTPGDPEVYLYALCTNSDRGVPSSYTKFSPGPIADKKLLEVLKKNDEEGLYHSSGQSIVWNVTDDMDIDSLSNKIQRTLKIIKIKILTILKVIITTIKTVIVASIFVLIIYCLYEKFILKKKKKKILLYKFIQIINNTRKKLSKILSKK